MFVLINRVFWVESISLLTNERKGYFVNFGDVINMLSIRFGYLLIYSAATPIMVESLNESLKYKEIA